MSLVMPVPTTYLFRVKQQDNDARKIIHTLFPPDNFPPVYGTPIRSVKSDETYVIDESYVYFT